MNKHQITGETVRDSLSFIEKLDGKEIVELENAIDEALEETITNTGEELLRLAEGEKTKNTEGKTYYDGHPDVIKDQAIDTLKKHIINVTGVE